MSWPRAWMPFWLKHKQELAIPQAYLTFLLLCLVTLINSIYVLYTILSQCPYLFLSFTCVKYNLALVWEECSKPDSVSHCGLPTHFNLDIRQERKHFSNKSVTAKLKELFYFRLLSLMVESSISMLECSMSCQRSANKSGTWLKVQYGTCIKHRKPSNLSD